MALFCPQPHVFPYMRESKKKKKAQIFQSPIFQVWWDLSGYFPSSNSLCKLGWEIHITLSLTLVHYTHTGLVNESLCFSPQFRYAFACGKTYFGQGNGLLSKWIFLGDTWVSTLIVVTCALKAVAGRNWLYTSTKLMGYGGREKGYEV
jgi:hypothetical protein